MAAKNSLSVEIEAGIDNFVRGLKAADAATVKFSNSVVSSFSPISSAISRTTSSISSGFSGAFTDMAKGAAVGTLVANGVMMAVGAIKDFAVGTVNAAADQEASLNRLSQALRATGESSAASLDDLVSFADELQRASIYSDDAIIAQIALAKNFGATNEEAKKLVQAAANLSAAFGGSLEERVQQLSVTLTGSVGKLGKLNIGLDDLTTASLKAGGAADLINSKFSGAAANELTTYAGKSAALTNALGALQSELGGVFIRLSAVSGSKSLLTDVFQGLADRIKNYRLEQARSNGTLVETQSTVEQLRDKLNDLQQQQTDLSADAKDFAEKNWLARALTAPIDRVAANAYQILPDLRAEIARVQAQYESARDSVNAGGAGTVDPNKPKVKTNEELEAEKRALADQMAIKQQMKAADAEFAAYKSNLALANSELTAEQRDQEYKNSFDHEMAKVEAVRQAELAKAALITDEGTRNLTIRQINQKAELDQNKFFHDRVAKQDKDAAEKKKQINNLQWQTAETALQAGMAVAKEGSFAMRAMQIAQATMSTYTAANLALSSPPGPPYTIPLAAATVALGLANVAKIAGAKFEQGGIVGGSSYHGDKTPILANSGEMILNKNQQSEMFRQLNGSSTGMNDGAVDRIISAIRSAPIVVEANGRELARLVRDERNNGFAV